MGKHTQRSLGMSPTQAEAKRLQSSCENRHDPSPGMDQHSIFRWSSILNDESVDEISAVNCTREGYYSTLSRKVEL